VRFRGKRQGLRLIFFQITRKTPALARVSWKFRSKRRVGAGVLVLVRRKSPHFSSRKYIDHGPNGTTLRDSHERVRRSKLRGEVGREPRIVIMRVSNPLPIAKEGQPK